MSHVCINDFALVFDIPRAAFETFSLAINIRACTLRTCGCVIRISWTSRDYRGLILTVVVDIVIAVRGVNKDYI